MNTSVACYMHVYPEPHKIRAHFIADCWDLCEVCLAFVQENTQHSWDVVCLDGGLRNFKFIVKGMGYKKYFLLDKTKDIKKIINKFLASNGPCLLEVIITGTEC